MSKLEKSAREEQAELDAVNAKWQAELEYYLNTDKRDKEHESSPMPIIHTGVPYPPRKCPYCFRPCDGLRALYNHERSEHPDRPIKA